MKIMGQNVGKILAMALLAVACAVGAWCLQPRRMTAGETQSEMIVAGLGGFRGLIAEVIWFRADRLQEEGRYAELAQLATTLTMLEPHTAEVWAYAAWNLAYNVSVMMPDAVERWRWVEAGIRLLRDDGLRLNPHDPVLYRELAWMFLAKVGGQLDSASPYYSAEWAKKIAAAPQAEDWPELKMVAAVRASVETEYGSLNWQKPLATALYWAYLGLNESKTAEDRRELRQIVWQALMLLSKDDARFAPRALKEMRTAFSEHPSGMLHDLIQRYRDKFNLE